MTDEREQPAPQRAWKLNAAVLRVGARAVSAALATLAAVALILTATVTTGPAWRSGAPELTVDPLPAAEQRLCPGPALRLGGTSGEQATIATSAGRPVVVSEANPGEVERAALDSTDNVLGVAPDRLTLPPQTAGSTAEAQLAGSQSETVTAGTFTGFAAADCIEATSEAWLSAGSTTVGRTSLIAISNPSSVGATVDLTIWGTAGEVAAPGTTGLIIPPGAQRVYPLAGFAPGLESTVVRVQSRGGPIVATLHESIVRTLAAGGVDIAGPSAPPATLSTIPGIVVSGADAVTAAGATAGFDDIGTVIRLLSAGADVASAVVTITRATAVDAPAIPAPAPPDTTAPDADTPGAGDTIFTVSLEPGMVQDLRVPGLSDGTYTVSVVATAPITASARVSTVSAEGDADLAWVASAQSLDDTSLVAVAPGPGPILTLANPTQETITVTVGGETTPQTIGVEPAASVSLSVAAGARLELTGARGLVAAVSYSGPGALASFPVSVPAASSTAVRVYRGN